VLADGVRYNQDWRQSGVHEDESNPAVVPIFSALANGHRWIANEQMECPIFAVIGQRLVTRVDDGAVELHPLIDVVHDVVSRA